MISRTFVFTASVRALACPSRRPARTLCVSVNDGGELGEETQALKRMVQYRGGMPLVQPDGPRSTTSSARPPPGRHGCGRCRRVVTILWAGQRTRGQPVVERVRPAVGRESGAPPARIAGPRDHPHSVLGSASGPIIFASSLAGCR